MTQNREKWCALVNTVIIFEFHNIRGISLIYRQVLTAKKRSAVWRYIQ
jgi:hypothetical protein